jgi:hypothetical protein
VRDSEVTSHTQEGTQAREDDDEGEFTLLRGVPRYSDGDTAWRDDDGVEIENR